MKRLFIIIIRGYQKYISPLFGQKCRFVPTCSDYCIEAINCYGLFKGIIKSLLRICRCHPFHPGGYDPINKNKNS